MKSRLAHCLLLSVAYLPLPLLHGLGWLVGRLLWWLPNDLRRITLMHLDRCLPALDAAERRRIARESLAQMAMSVLEAPALWFGPERRLRRWLDDPPARAALQRLLSDRGLILLTPHLGAWELAGLFVSAHAPITSLYKPQKGVFDALIRQGRERLGARLVPTTGGGVKSLLEALRRHESIGVLPDHDPPPGSGVFAPLFGIPAHTTELVSKLAARSGAPVCYCYAERLRFGRGYRMHFVPAELDIADPVSGVANMNLGLERCLQRLPEQYWWSYKRYRRRPAGEAFLYGQE